MFASIDVAGIPRSAPAPDNSVLGIERSYFGTDGKPWSPRPLKEGEALIVRVTVTADTTMPDALLTDLPAGLEIENFHLGDANGGPMWWSMASPSATAVKRRYQARRVPRRPLCGRAEALAWQQGQRVLPGARGDPGYLLGAATAGGGHVPAAAAWRWPQQPDHDHGGTAVTARTGRDGAARPAGTTCNEEHDDDPAGGCAAGGALWPWLRWGMAPRWHCCWCWISPSAPLPKQRETSTLVVAADGTPLRAFADAEGVWRYHCLDRQRLAAVPAGVADLRRPLVLAPSGDQPGGVLRASGQLLRSGRIVSGGSTLTMQVARILDPHSRTP